MEKTGLKNLSAFTALHGGLLVHTQMNVNSKVPEWQTLV
jgi:hypothetical protein